MEKISQKDNKEPYISVNAQAEGAFMALLSVILGLVVYVPFLCILSIAGPVPTLLLVIRRGIKASFLATLVAGCIFSFIAGFREGILFVINFNLVGLALGMAIKWKWSVTRALISGTLVNFISAIVAIFLLAGLMGINMEKSIDQARLQAMEVYKAMNFTQEQLEQISEQMNFNVELCKIIFISLLLFTSLITIFVQYIVAQLILKKLGYLIPPLPAFKSWRLSWHYAWLLITGIILTYLGMPEDMKSSAEIFEHIKPLGVVGINILYLCAILYFTIGISIIYSFLDKFKVPLIGKILICFFLAFCAQYMVLFLGLFDTWVDFRKLQKPEEKTADK
ncbi:MAG TPA: YybS family protein [Candidatus Eremiobacteraeota bacterium]|nr:MAG: hypothetical protein BWY64_03898 [bacterium ADurb.Bin363]HPZ10288.1 YybS family protein [Candidatus Eremiobacteraeota bacterium]